MILQLVHGMSKDFVEHLRTVHFALIAVSVGLIALMLSSKPYNPEMALIQLSQIMQLQKSWSTDWIVDRGGLETAPLLETPFEQKSEQVYTLDGQFYGDLTFKGQTEHSMALFEGLKDTVHCESSDIDTTSFPKTLAEFQPWWNGLATPCEVYLPQVVSGRGTVEDWKANQMTVIGQIKTIGLHDRAAPKAASTIKLGISRTTQNGKHSFSYFGHLFDKAYRIPITQVQMSRIGQKEIASFFNWSEGSFDESFFDLSRAGRVVMALEFSDVQRLLSQSGTHTTEVFEAFGMKFPAGQITLWGAIIILGIQLYFVAYLKQFSSRLKNHDSNNEVPWIGIDPSSLSRLLFFSTMVPLPSLAMFSLGMFFVSRPFQRWTTSTWAELSAWLIGLLCCIVLALVSWANRPCKFMEQPDGQLIASEPSPPFRPE